MRILHLVPTLSAGGAETFVTDLAIAQRKLGQSVDVFLLVGTIGERGDKLLSSLNSDGIECFSNDVHGARDPRNAIRLLRLILNGHYDVIHAHLFSVEFIAAFLTPILNASGKRPLLVRTLHNSDIYGTHPRVFTKLLARAFDWNFACGTKVWRNYKSIFGDGRGSVIENGIRDFLEPDRAAVHSFRAQLGLPADAFLITCIGAFRGTALTSSQKAQDIAIRAFSSAFQGDQSAHLLLAGDGALRFDAEQLARQINSGGTIHFLGNLPDVTCLLWNSDLLFMPSRFEGLPIVGLEAGCAGLPVLASSIDELVEVGTSFGWIFSKDNSTEDFAECLIEIRNDHDAVKNHANETRSKFRERYSIERCAQEYVVQLQKLLDLKLARRGY